VKIFLEEKDQITSSRNLLIGYLEKIHAPRLRNARKGEKNTTRRKISGRRYGREKEKTGSS